MYSTVYILIWGSLVLGFEIFSQQEVSKIHKTNEMLELSVTK